MSQEQEPTLITARKQRTRRRAARPVLVTGSATDTGELEPQANEQNDLQTGPLAEETVVETKPARASRLPRFFSKVAREEAETATPDDEIARARLARAARNGKTQASSAKSGAKDESSKTEGKTEGNKARPASKPNQPPKLFKPRHFLGMGIYLIGAQLILPYEALFANAIGLGKPFFNIPLFGQQLPINAALFLNIATLIILLYLLVKLDLLPSTLTARTTAEQRARARAKEQSSNKTSVEKVAPPAIRQGVKGADDELYQAYRQGQRRDKRR